MVKRSIEKLKKVIMPSITHRAYEKIKYPSVLEVLRLASSDIKRALAAERNVLSSQDMQALERALRSPVSIEAGPNLLHFACAILMSSYNLSFGMNDLLPSYMMLEGRVGSHGYLFKVRHPHYFHPLTVISFRGTINSEDLISDMNAVQTTFTDSRLIPHEGALVHLGFSQVWENTIMDFKTIEQDIMTPRKKKNIYLSEDMRNNKPNYGYEASPNVIIVGHSLGGSTAYMAALSLVSAGYKGVVTLIVIGTPRVGNEKFVSAIETCPNIDLICVANKTDVVPDLPPPVFGFGKTSWMYSTFAPNVHIDVQTGSIRGNHSVSTYGYGITGQVLDDTALNPVWHRPPTYTSSSPTPSTAQHVIVHDGGVH